MAIIPIPIPTETSKPTLILFSAAPRTVLNGRSRQTVVPVNAALEFVKANRGFRMKEIRYDDGALQKTWEWSDRQQYDWLLENTPK